MASFVTVINNIATALQNDTALKAFCLAKWARPLTVKFIFRKKAEVSLSEYPIILITRPAVKKTIVTNIKRDTDNTLRLYCLFSQKDPVLGARELVEFEEYIDDALTGPEPETLGAISLTPGESMNDEGAGHPEYFIAMLVQVHHRR